METFLTSLNTYLSNISGSSWNLFFPLIMLGCVLLLTLFITWRKSSKSMKKGAKEETKATIMRKILCSMYISGVATISITTIIVICLLKFTAFFGHTFCQFGVIIGFILIGIWTFVAYLLLCIKTKNKKMQMYEVPISREALNKRFLHLKLILNKKFWWGLLFVALPFLLLLAPFNKSANLSIIFDNSGSMSEVIPWVSESLEQTLMKSPNGHFVFTTLDIIKNKEIKDTTVNQYFNTIISTKKPSNLPTYTQVFNSSAELCANLYSIGNAGLSPIYQGIWQNYLTARKEYTNNQYKKLILISDGADNLYALLSFTKEKFDKNIFQQKDETGQTPEEFFDGGIYVINFGDSDGQYLFADCQNSITEMFDGYDRQSYFNALVNILPEMFFDWVLIYFIISIIVITFIAVLISKLTVK